jgi:hypothetical protein
MARSFTPFDLVTLPRLDADETLTLTAQILTHARAEKGLTKGVARVVAELAERELRLRDALIINRKAPGVDPKTAREADRTVDNAWSALRSWVDGWKKLPASAFSHSDALLRLDAAIFNEGLEFLNYSFEKEHTQSELRLAIIKKDHEPVILALGGEPFLKHLRAAHDAYGKALHITVPAPSASPPADVRAAMDAVHGKLREYVTQVVAAIREEKPATQARAERLLRPLAEWESQAPAKTEAKEPPKESPPT